MQEANFPKRGRPRSEQSQAAILRTAFEVLCEKGYTGMSIEGVAARAGVGKATIYRWWTSREELAVQAFFSETTEELAFPDTGSAREDFRSQIQQLGTLLRGEQGAALAAMIAAGRTDAKLRKALFTRWIEPRREWGRKRLRKAIREGECHAGIHVDAALESLYSPLYARLLFGLPPPTREEIDRVLRIVLTGIFHQPKRDH